MTDGLPSPPPWPVARGPERWLVPGRTGNFDLACGVPSRPPPRLSDSTGLPSATIPPESARAPAAHDATHTICPGPEGPSVELAGASHRPEGRPSLFRQERIRCSGILRRSALSATTIFAG